MKHVHFRRMVITLLIAFGFSHNVSAGTYASITINGTNFSDWAAVPVLATATNGTSGTNLDLATLSIANDESNIYLLITYNQPVNPNAGPSVYLAFDTDNNPNTGFNSYGIGLIGSEVGWENDTPFVQSNGVFNTGGTLTGGTAAIAPYYSVTTTQEYAISRFATYSATGQPVFSNNTFTLMVYADPTPNLDLLGPVQYTFATQTTTGTYATIPINGIFSAWAGVPVLAWLPPGTSGTNVDLGTLSMANDSSNLYLLITYNQPVNPNAGPSVYLALQDTPDTSLGFNVFGLGLIYSEAGWENDYPFAQSNGVFNTGGGITGGDALITPYYSVTMTQEYAISRAATFTTNGASIFPSNTFTLAAYVNPSVNLDMLGPVQYTFATNVVPSTYAHITIDGDFSDWIGVPVLFTGPPNDGLPLGVRTVQMANDQSNLYIRLTYYTTVNPQLGDGVYLAIQDNSDTNLGFNIYSEGLVYSEVGWQNATPFAQSNGVFNAGAVNNGTALIAPYNSLTSAQEYALPLSATFAATGAPVFQGNSLTLLVYTTSGSIIDVSGPVQYTFAAPATFQIVSVARSGNNITLTWTAPGGTTNIVQAETGNYNTNNFVNISTNFFNPGPAPVAVTNQYTDTQASTNRPARFYRISQLP